MWRRCTGWWRCVHNVNGHVSITVHIVHTHTHIQRWGRGQYTPVRSYLTHRYTWGNSNSIQNLSLSLFNIPTSKKEQNVMTWRTQKGHNNTGETHRWAESSSHRRRTTTTTTKRTSTPAPTTSSEPQNQVVNFWPKTCEIFLPLLLRFRWW